MDVRMLIKALLGVEVNTDDLNKLLLNPEECVESPEAAQKLRDLFLLIEMAEQMGGAPDA